MRGRRSRRLTPAWLAAAAALACARGGERPPDVLWVVLDTVRADRLMAYGSPRKTGLVLDTLARQGGVLFEDVTAPAPWTWPSHASLFTGEPVWVHGAHLAPLGPAAEAPAAAGALEHQGFRVLPLRGDLPTLAERFAAGGYRTAALSANDWLDPRLGLVRGFAEARVLETDDAVAADACHESARERERPLLLFVNLMPAHMPYHEIRAPWLAERSSALDPATAPPWLRPYLVVEDGLRGVELQQRAPGDADTGVVRFLRGELAIPPDGIALLLDLYDGELVRADRLLGQILACWTEQRGDQVVAIASDHGEYFGEHGLLEHRGTLYPPVLRVPLVLVAPGRLPAGVRVAAPVELRRLHATLLELAGLARSPDSLVALARGGTEPARPLLAAAWPDPVWASRVGGRLARRWQLFRSADEVLLWSDAGDLELYDAARDPGLARDLARERPARARELRERAAPLFAGVDEGGRAPLALPPDQAERLRALGYAVE